MQDEIRIRAAREHDCPAICDIYNHYVRSDTCTYALEPETLQERQAWLRDHGPDHPVIVAHTRDDVDTLVGWASLSPFHSRCGYRLTVEDTVYLDPAWRGRGVGSRLLGTLVQRARELGHHTIIAGISSEQTASLALHERFQFARVAHLREVGHKFGRWLDVVYMQRMLGHE